MALVLSAKKPNGRQLPVETDEKRTPQDFYDQLNALYDFELDTAAGHAEEMHRCDRYYTIEDNALKQSWVVEEGKGRYCNPPYSNVWPWVIKCIMEADKQPDAPVVLLVMAATSSLWFKHAFEHAAEVIFVVGNLKFGKHGRAAPYGSVVFVFKGKHTGDPLVRMMDRDVDKYECEVIDKNTGQVCGERFVKYPSLTGHMRSAHGIRKRSAKKSSSTQPQKRQRTGEKDDV